jgi:hypothetical protein
MGRLVAAVIALAIFVTGAMYWSSAHQDAQAAPNDIYPCAKDTVQPQAGAPNTAPNCNCNSGAQSS